jgi:hypothetical protein
MTARFDRAWAKASRANLLLALSASQRASAAPATPEQRRARTPDASRLCPCEIADVPAVTNCLRRQKASLSQACKAVFEQ